MRTWQEEKLRDLAKNYAEAANSPEMARRRVLWKKHNSLKEDTPLIDVRPYMCKDLFSNSIFVCTDPKTREWEKRLRMLLFLSELGDDTVMEPFLTVPAIHNPPVVMRWGIPVQMGEVVHEGGASAFAPSLKDEDFTILKTTGHRINEEKTTAVKEYAEYLFGDILKIEVDRSSVFQAFCGDISADLAKLRGLEQIMWDAYDRPEWLHSLLAFMRDSILKAHDEAENAGDLSLAAQFNQTMPYCDELPDICVNSRGAKRKELWCFMASQEFTTFSPDMFYEFLLQYQIPIIERFGLCAYGCCEDLTHKIDYLRKIKNLRIIAISPFADVRQCAESIGKDYCISYRPSPAEMLARGLDEDFARNYLRENIKILRENHCIFHVTMKDIETVNGEPENLKRFIQIAREEINK